MWARLTAYAAIAFGAACFWLLLGGSPAAADEGSSGLFGPVTSTVAEPRATKPVAGLADRVLRQVADVERQATDTVREAAAGAPVETVSPVVDRVTRALDEVTSQAVGTGEGAVEQPGSLAGEPTTGPETDAPHETGLVATGPGLHAEPTGLSTATRAASAHHLDAWSGQSADAAGKAPAVRVAWTAPAGGPVLDTAPAPTEEAPDDTSTVGGGASVVTAVAPTTTVRLPETKGAPVVPVACPAPQQPAFPPGFAPD